MNDIELASLSSSGRSSSGTPTRRYEESADTSARDSLYNYKPPSNAGVKSKIARFCSAAWQGPRVPRDTPPRPITRLGWMEAVPARYKKSVSPAKRTALFAAYVAVWALLWARILWPYLSEAPVDSAGRPVVALTCGQADSLWRGKNAACGLDAERCSVPDSVVFRCPALCDRGSWLYSMRAVGDQLVKYRGYFIGGGHIGSGGKSDEKGSDLSLPYRADSFPCGAGVHSGLVSPFFGGCARIAYRGSQDSFGAAKGHYGVSDSIGFESYFPFSYVFEKLTGSPTHCHDPRLVVLLLNIILGAPVVYLSSGVTAFWTLTVVGFWTITLATDPPVLVEPQDPQSLYELVSVGLERFLPTCFVLYVLWAVSVKRTFDTSRSDYEKLQNDDIGSGLESYEPSGIDSHIDIQFTDKPAPASPVTRLLLWYPLFWLGILNNISFDRLPVDRLTWHDLQVQPGALLTVIVVASVLVCCIVAQAYYVWLSGRFWKLLAVYGAVFGSLFVLGSLPGLTLRIHHYIFALVFIPGCSTRGRTALAFQGILAGLFLSGVARWGYASIAETNVSLLRGEPIGAILPPQMTHFANGSLYWENVQTKVSDATANELKKYTHVSILVNDIERVRDEDLGSVDVAQLLTDIPDHNVTVYLRVAKYSSSTNRYGDFSRAALLEIPSYEFTPAPPGIT